ncbi:MAG: hypothetical protein GDA36_12690 [Rhodobacteraceae bacterium]|nr:hypothetical protein [Paracoccaceae bacterium]
MKSRWHQPRALTDQDQRDQEFPNRKYFCYVLKTDRGHYVGHTYSVRARFAQHRRGESESTRGTNPELVWQSGPMSSRQDAARFEAALKSWRDQGSPKFEETTGQFPKPWKRRPIAAGQSPKPDDDPSLAVRSEPSQAPVSDSKPAPVRPEPSQGQLARGIKVKSRWHQPEALADQDQRDQEFPNRKYFCYVLKTDRGHYVGHTWSVRVRVAQHRRGDSASTRGTNPKLVWQSVPMSSRQDAARFEAALKSWRDQGSPKFEETTGQSPEPWNRRPIAAGQSPKPDDDPPLAVRPEPPHRKKRAPVSAPLSAPVRPAPSHRKKRARRGKKLVWVFVGFLLLLLLLAFTPG